MYNDILRQYPTHQILKSGGQKVVYIVDHPMYGTVVLKVGPTGSPSSLERIRREVEILSNISSIYYPKQYSFDIVSRDRFVIIEEYIHSTPLSQCLPSYSNQSSLLQLMLYLLEGLTILWNNNIIHRDLKPDNILIRPNGLPVIIDLGIARPLNLMSLTKTMAPMGPCTPFYAAPEQLWNRKACITHRTDQFCLGIVAAQLQLSGKHPFDPAVVGSGDSIIMNIINNNWAKDILRNSAQDSFYQIIHRMLSREPFQRFPSYLDLIFEIAKCKGAANA